MGDEIVDRIAAYTHIAVDIGVEGMSNLVPLSVADLNPLAAVCHNQLIKDCGITTPVH